MLLLQRGEQFLQFAVVSAGANEVEAGFDFPHAGVTLNPKLPPTTAGLFASIGLALVAQAPADASRCFGVAQEIAG
ncbi:MAG: hypothetical protein P8K07_05240 [Candidatus Binatia bacterium]|nr:hypothetical protein [Candidatus Binatia bacterium]